MAKICDLCNQDTDYYHNDSMSPMWHYIDKNDICEKCFQKISNFIGKYLTRNR